MIIIMKLPIVVRKIMKKIDEIRYTKLYFGYRKYYGKKQVKLPKEGTARENLHKIRKHDKEKECCRANNKIKDKKYDLTIIIAAYNVEKYIIECLDSILTQTTEYRYFIKVVNDGSTDSTKILLDRYKEDYRVQIINQNNCGLSGARNTGLKEIESNYVLFCDADDIMKEGSIQLLLSIAYQNNLDIVEGSYEIFHNQKVLSYHKHSKKLILNNTESGQLFGFAWNKLIRSELLEQIKFNEGYLFEDTIGIYIIYPQAKRIGLVDTVTYGYRKNSTGIMHSIAYNEKAIDTYWIMEQLLSDIENMHLTIDRSYLYQITLEQIVTNYNRLWFLEEKLQRELFVLTCSLVHRYFPEERTKVKGWNDLEQSLRNNNYLLYKLFLKGKKRT